MLYFSYAANLNRAHMARLCPGAKPLYPAVIEGYELTVRRWFNVEPEEGGNVQGGIWRISRKHLARLDGYEDSPELYERKLLRILPVRHGSMGVGAQGRVGCDCIAYLMREPLEIPITPPDPGYLEMVREGYREWRISSGQVEEALRVVFNF